MLSMFFKWLTERSHIYRQSSPDSSKFFDMGMNGFDGMCEFYDGRRSLRQGFDKKALNKLTGIMPFMIPAVPQYGIPARA